MTARGSVPLSVGYLVKRYPRLSETFILNEILALEARGVAVTVLALRRPAESRFHEKLARVRAEVVYAPDVRASNVLSFLRSRLDAIRGRESILSESFWRLLERGDLDDLGTLVKSVALSVEVQRRGIRHLHAHFATSAASAANHVARFTGIGYSFTAHAKDIFHESVDFDSLREKAAGADFVVAVSDCSAGFLRDRLGAAGSKVRRLYNGLDLGEFPVPNRSGVEPNLIASIARLVPKKGLPTLIEAVRRLVQSGVDLRLEILGDGEDRASLEEQVRASGLCDRVRFRGGQPHSEARALLGRASLFALPARIAEDGNRDGLPVSIVEAMASGVPVVSTPVVGIPEAVEDGVTGLLVPPDDPSALADALRRILENPSEAARMAFAARRRVEERFDGERNAALLDRWFEECVASRVPSRSSALSVAAGAAVEDRK